MAAIITCPQCGSIWNLSEDEARQPTYNCEKCMTPILTSAAQTNFVTCAKCGRSYERQYDGCPACATRSGWGVGKVVGTVLIVLAILFFCSTMWAFVGDAFMEGVASGL